MTDERMARRLQARLAAEQAQQRLPSVTAGLVRDSGLAWSGRAGDIGLAGSAAAGGGPGSCGPDGGAGTAADGVQYRAGSITKTFVAVAVLALRDAGRLDLADPVARHVPAAGELAGATVGQLLSHTSGLRAETAGPWWERTAGGPMAGLAAGSLGPGAARWRAGRRYHYSNVGYALLGELLARAHGAPWDQVIARELLRPLGMTRTTTRPQPPYARGLAVHPHADLVLPEPEHDAGAMAPAGQLWTTVADLAAWARFLSGDTGGLLAGGTLAEMREPLTVEDLPGQPWAAAYGLGLQLWNSGGRRSYGHSGSMPGFTAMLRIDAGDGSAAGGDAVIVACNSTAGFSPQLPADLLAIAAAAEPALPPPWAPAAGFTAAGPDGAGLTALAGTWYWGPVPYVLSVAGPAADGAMTLTLRQVGRLGRTSRFRRSAAGTWTGLDGYHAGEPLVPVPGPDGQPVALDLGSFLFTRTPYDPLAPVPGGTDAGGWRAPA